MNPLQLNNHIMSSTIQFLHFSERDGDLFAETHTDGEGLAVQPRVEEAGDLHQRRERLPDFHDPVERTNISRS